MDGVITLVENSLDSLSENNRFIVDVTENESTDKMTAALTKDEVDTLKAKNAVFSLNRKDIHVDIPMENYTKF